MCSGYSPVTRFNRFKSILSLTLLQSPLSLIFFFCHPKWGARQRRGALEETNTYFIPGYLLAADTAVFQALVAKDEEIYLHAGHPASQSAAAQTWPQLKFPAFIAHMSKILSVNEKRWHSLKFLPLPGELSFSLLCYRLFHLFPTV